MPFIEVKSVNQWNEIVSMAGGGEDNKTYIIVAKMGATWCGPCRAMLAPFKRMSEEYDDALFLDIDIDELPDVADKFEVTSVPTILVINGNSIVKRLVGGGSSVLSDIRGAINSIA
jgi:thioredoxin 1